CIFASDHSAELHKSKQHCSDGCDLRGAQMHQITKQLYRSALLRDALAKTRQHALFESRMGFFLSESFFQNFVQRFGLLMSFPAGSAIDEVCVKRAAFLIGEFTVKVAGEPVVDFVVNGCHMFNPLKPWRGEVVCASKRGRGREFRAAPHWSVLTCF